MLLYMKDWIKRCVLLWQFLCLAGLLLFAGCGQAMLSDENLARRSKKEFSKMKQNKTLSQNRSYQGMIKEIGERIAGVAQVDLPGTEWEFVVFQNDEPNAFAMPGGKVGVNTGLIDLAAGNEDEVAAVMGHEIAHVALETQQQENEPGDWTRCGWGDSGCGPAKPKFHRANAGQNGLWGRIHRGCCLAFQPGQ